MFWLLVVTGLLIAIFCGVGLLHEHSQFDPPTSSTLRNSLFLGCFVGVALFCSAFATAQGKLYVQKLIASSRTGNWLIIDNSGGVTLRHWVLEQGYVESSDQSDGWQFFDGRGNGPCYVSGDAYVMKINEPLAEFMKDYREEYNIPEEQKALK